MVIEMLKGYFEIWQPRYHDRVVLLACKNVIDGVNKVRFTKSDYWNGEYTIKGHDIKTCSIESNGKIQCYVVPLDRLTSVKKTEKTRWVLSFKCPNCGHTQAASSKFCPNCGKEMRL